MKNKKLTVKEKVSLVANMPEIQTAVKILTALMIDAKVKNYISYEYVINNQRYRFVFTKVKGAEDKEIENEKTKQLLWHLYAKIKHGDKEHREWLKNKVQNFINANLK